MRNRIRLDTLKDAYDFVAVVSKLPGKIYLTDGDEIRINAKSVLGALYSLEFDELWIESDTDIYTKIQKFIQS